MNFRQLARLEDSDRLERNLFIFLNLPVATFSLYRDSDTITFVFSHHPSVYMYNNYIDV